MSLYMGFGLIIESALELPELLPLESGTPDVQVLFCSVDISEVYPPGAEAPPKGAWWQAKLSQTKLLFGCHAGIFEITSGSRINIDVAPDAAPETIRMFLLGSALGGAIQIQRGRIPIHGGSIVLHDQAMIITGTQGAGKSTMTSALVKNGFKYLTDDVSSVELFGTSFFVHAAYPQRKLVRDACTVLGLNTENLPVIDTTRDKFAIRDPENWHGTAAPLRMLIELVPADAGEKLRSEPVNGHAKLSLLMRSLYRDRMHFNNQQLPPEEFKKILNIAAALDALRIYIPRRLDDILLLAENLAEELEFIQ